MLALNISFVETPLEEKRSNSSMKLLQTSPYNEEPHLLDLSSLAVPQQFLAQALVYLRPVRNDYATASYIDSFNWSEIIHALKNLLGSSNHGWVQRSFYIVVFRSQVLATTDRLHLGALDKRSHAEAMKSGGLLKYWFGTPDICGRNLATCVWDKREDAQIGGRGEGHKAAARATSNLYSEWKVERLRFDIGDGIEHWTIREW